jgi:hypothetical protein
LVWRKVVLPLRMNSASLMVNSFMVRFLFSNMCVAYHLYYDNKNI